MKKSLSIITFIIILLLESFIITGCHDSVTNNIDETKIILNGKNISQETTVIAKDDDFYIPVQFLCNSLNVTFDYSLYKGLTISVESHTLTSNQRIGEANLRMFFDKDIVRVNGVNRKADKKPFIDNEIIYIPICYTMKLLGYEVEQKNNSQIMILPAEKPIKKKLEDGEEIYYVYYEYDDKGNLIKETTDDSTYYLYEYDDRGKLMRETTDNFGGIERTYKYNQNGGYAEKHSIYGDGSYDTYRFDNNGNLIYHEDEYGGSTEYIYDADGKILFEEYITRNGAVRKTTYEYDERTIREHISYDNEEELIRIWSQDKDFLIQCLSEELESINYNEEENSIEIITKKSRGKWTYDEKNCLIKEEYTGGYIYFYEYDEFGNLLVKRDNAGEEKIRNKYNEQGKIVEKMMDNSVEKYKYDEDNRLIYVEFINSDGEKRREEYIYK